MSDRLIQKIFQSQYPRLIASRQPVKNKKAIYALTHCKTPDLGSSVFQCAERHKPIELNHSCRHRSCYLCAQRARNLWVEAQRDRLLNCAHFHVIFTLPHEYLNLWRYNEGFFSNLLFSASRDTLMLVADRKYHGVTPGIMTALHTWGRQLSLHPHVHCLVTAGGLTGEDCWQAIDNYLLPIQVVKARYRGLIQMALQEAVDDGSLVLPPDLSMEAFKSLWRGLWKKAWSVRIEEKYSHGKGVMLYLSRYLKGGPLNPRQISRVDHQSVEFRYLDHRDKRKKNLRLSLAEFTQRLLTHVPHVGMHTLRYYGLYAPAAKRRRLLAYGAVRGTLRLPRSTSLTNVVLSCQICGGLARHSFSKWRNEVSKASSIYREGPRVTDFVAVQQDDEADPVGDKFMSSA